MELEIHTDCSGNKRSKDFGFSCIFYYKGVEYYHSYSITQEKLRELLEVTEDVSNPTVEVFAVNEVLAKFRLHLEDVPYQKINLKLKIYSDYRGVSCWFNKEWAINKKYIRTLIRLARRSSEILKLQWGIETEVLWVKGHNGHSQNERADKLAGLRLNESNLEEFFKIYKSDIKC